MLDRSSAKKVAVPDAPEPETQQQRDARELAQFALPAAGGPQSSVRPYRVVITDIEGTTTDISFVREVLFPYARDHVAAFLRDGLHRGDPEVIALALALAEQQLGEEVFPPMLPEWVALLRQAPAQDSSSMPEPLILAMEGYVHWLMGRDSKTAPLKALQGAVWRAAYQSGQVHAPMYCDVVAALAYWRAANVPVYVYSSGSAAAQRLLFAHTEFGDLRGQFTGFFDASGPADGGAIDDAAAGVGPKMGADSYARIAARIAAARAGWGEGPADMLFLSDNPRELAAARAAGMQVALVVRPGNPILREALAEGLPMHEYAAVSNFAQLLTPEVHRALHTLPPPAGGAGTCATGLHGGASASGSNGAGNKRKADLPPSSSRSPRRSKAE